MDNYSLGSGSSGPWCYKHSDYCDSATPYGSCRLNACIKHTVEEENTSVGMNDAWADNEYRADIHTRKLRAEMEAVPDQTAKSDAGKPRVSLVPSAIVRCIAKVREYGLTRYADPDNWKRVSVERYRDAMYRHVLSYIDDPHGVDEESGLPHLWHIACNVAFLCALEKKEDK